MTKLALKTGLIVGLNLVAALIVLASVGCLSWSVAYFRDFEALFASGRYIALGMTVLGCVSWIFLSAHALTAMRLDVRSTLQRWGDAKRRSAHLELVMQPRDVKSELRVLRIQKRLERKGLTVLHTSDGVARVCRLAGHDDHRPGYPTCWK